MNMTFDKMINFVLYLQKIIIKFVKAINNMIITNELEKIAAPLHIAKCNQSTISNNFEIIEKM